MWKPQTLGIIIYALLELAQAQPIEVPRYNQLGYKYPKPNRSSCYNNSVVVSTTDRLGATVTTPAPQFDYALLGQDPTDQHWYRVSLTPTNNKSVYRAQFATRKSPPYNEQETHKHDRTIKEMLNFLEKSEEHNLVKAYRQLLASEDSSEQEAKIKQNPDQIEIEVDSDVELSHDMKTSASRPLVLVDGVPRTTPTNNNQSNSKDSNMVRNFVYFIKRLK